MSRLFRLTGLLRLRELQEEQAAAVLARANADRTRAVERHRETRNLMAGTMFPAHGDENVWRAAVADRAAMASLVTEAAVAAQVVARRSEIAAAEWAAAKTSVSTLEKLAERHAVLVRTEDEHAEQLVLDEAASRRHQEDR